ncbi:phage tail tape measure protein [Dysgonomonas sp. 521]|uniref:phage tail tape measure protein n=1 Tax=Dysgonomonas sp. 521 TaxID=2302932 RepID=UPI0013D35C72|nr:phage tail tape measure protein [Dysgonomonas sp. 521]NDV93551.1 phage tail tape measure protein [Dysgonomonas sp. 521]
MAGLAKLQLLIEIKDKLNVGLNKAKKKIERATGNMQNKLKAFSIENTKLFGAIKDEVPGVARAVTLLSNPYVLATAAVVALAGAVTMCTLKANEWHEKMAEINVTAELSKDKLGKLSDKLLDIGGRNVAPLEEVPKAFNRIISAGLSVNDSLATLEPTLRAAKAGFTDIEIAASAATSVMMATGYDAKRVYDILFETVKEGNAEFKDIAQYLPKVIPLAKNVGYELEQVAGAYAMLTGRLSTEQSTTALQGIMRALSSQRVAIGQIDKATGKYVSGFKSIGIDVFDPTTKKIKPILQIVTELNQKMAGLSDKQRMIQFDKLGLDQMGSLGFSSLMQDIPALQKAIDATTNSAGSLEKAYADSLTPMESWKIIQNQIKVEMIKIGELFLPIVSAIGNKILGIIQYWKDLYNNSQMFRDLLSGIGAVFEWLWNVSTIGFNLVINLVKNTISNVSILLSKFENWITKVTGVQFSFKKLYNTIRPYLVWLKEFLTEIGSLMYDVFTFNVNGVKDKISNFKLPDIGEIKQRVVVESADDDGDFSGVPTGSGPTSPDAIMPDNTNSSIADGARGIKGNSQTKNITINIDSFIKSFSPTHQSFNNMSTDEFERKMTEVFMRVVRSAETSM